MDAATQTLVRRATQHIRASGCAKPGGDHTGQGEQGRGEMGTQNSRSSFAGLSVILRHDGKRSYRTSSGGSRIIGRRELSDVLDRERRPAAPSITLPRPLAWSTCSDAGTGQVASECSARHSIRGGTARAGPSRMWPGVELSRLPIKGELTAFNSRPAAFGAYRAWQCWRTLNGMDRCSFARYGLRKTSSRVHVRDHRES